ncbi:MAG: NAD(P)H-dependent oxidoreductase [Alphaproteobacteria bacterium]|nr:NAD(P)H-dependent oxidoreductase [Alphaproteobacteria bacterium]
MTNILIIDGHQKYEFSKGELSATLALRAKDILSTKHTVKLTTIEKGYKIETEQDKFHWAESIIYQFPIFWFGVPAIMKQYMQDVYQYGILFTAGKKGYGTGGLLTDKTYMLSTTWNTPLSSFGKGFWKGVDFPDEVLTAFHHTQAFLGMKKLPSFSCHDVIKNPDINAYLKALERHLKLIFLK